MARGRRHTGTASEVLASLRESLRRGWRPGLTVLTGNDLYHLDLAQKALLEVLVPPDASEFALTVFGEQKVDSAAVVSAVRSVGMFAPRRVVLVREVAALEGDEAALAQYAENPPAASHLLVRAPLLDKRRKLHRTLATAGVLLEFAAAQAGETGRVVPEVIGLAESHGLSIDRRAAQLLAESCGCDFYRMEAELAKIAAWLGDDAASRVTVDTVREVACASGVLSGWEVADAILQRDLQSALAAVRRLIEAGDEALRMLGGITYRTSGMLQAKAMIERGCTAQAAVRAARMWWGDPRRTAAGLGRYTLQELLRFPAVLLEADRTLKSRQIAPRVVLESMVERMIGAPGGREART